MVVDGELQPWLELRCGLLGAKLLPNDRVPLLWEDAGSQRFLLTVEIELNLDIVFLVLLVFVLIAHLLLVLLLPGQGLVLARRAL